MITLRHLAPIIWGVVRGALPWLVVSMSVLGGRPEDWHWIIAVGAIPAVLNGLLWVGVVPRCVALGGIPRAAIVAGPVAGFIGTVLVSTFMQLPQVGKEEYQRFALAGVVQTALDFVGSGAVLL